MKKCIVMLSGGLDSRLAVKIMQEQGFEVTTLFFKLPFGTGCCDQNCSFNFSQMSGVKMKIVDCSKGELLQEYLKILKKPKYCRGSSMNPCLDCRLFMFTRAKVIADEQGIDLVVTGEVLNERPMSQHQQALDLVEKQSGLTGRLLRPLSAKLLVETEAEKKGLVDRSKLYDIKGRRRDKQMKLAEKFNMSYPSPGGGCYLCEKAVKEKLKFLFARGMDDNEIKLAHIGRHFVFDDCWVVLGKNQEENKIVEGVGTGELITAEDVGVVGPSAVILDKCNEKIREKVKKVILAYSKGVDLADREAYEGNLL